MSKFSEFLKKAMNAQGWDVIRLAEAVRKRTKVIVADAAIAAYASGKTVPKNAMIETLAKALPALDLKTALKMASKDRVPNTFETPPFGQPKTLGTVLREARLNGNMTLTDLEAATVNAGKKLDIGGLSKYERGICIPKKSSIDILGVVLDLDITELYRLREQAHADRAMDRATRAAARVKNGTRAKVLGEINIVKSEPKSEPKPEPKPQSEPEADSKSKAEKLVQTIHELIHEYDAPTAAITAKGISLVYKDETGAPRLISIDSAELRCFSDGRIEIKP